jgi:hypothetical protein
MLGAAIALLAVTQGAGAAAVATGDVTPVNDLPAAHQHRSGLVLGFTFGGGLAGASGYPNDQLKIGDPSYYAASGMMGGTTSTFFVMGALSDYVSVGFWYGRGFFRNHDWRSNGDGGGLRVEAFPLTGLLPSLHGLGVLAQFGIGGGDLMAVAPGVSGSDGTQSYAAGGVFHEWSFLHLLGGHVGAGPALEYDAIWSQSFERHGLVASARLVFYGGP